MSKFQLNIESLLGPHNKRSVANAGVAAVLQRIVGSVLTVISMVILSRLLPVEVFGLVALVTFFSIIIQAVVSSGLIESLQQTPDLTEEQFSKMFWLNGLVGIGCSALLLAVSPLAVHFYQDQRLYEIFYVLAASSFLSILFQPYQSLLQRNLEIGRQSFISISSAVLSLVISVTLALNGFTLFALLGAMLVTPIYRAILFLYCIRWIPRSLSWNADVTSMLHYGKRNGFAAILIVLSRNIQTIALGKWCNPAEVAYYNRGQSLFSQPIRQFAQPLQGVVFPAMCAARGDRRVVERLVMRSTWIMALALMPISALFVTLGDYATVIILGEKWAVSGEVVRFLALAEVTGLIGMSLGKGNSAIGRPARGLYITMSTLPIVVVGVFFIAKEGAVGVAIFLTCLRWLTAIPYIYLCLRGSGFRAKLYLRGIFRILFIFGLLLCLGFIIRSCVPAGFLGQVILISTFVAMGYMVFFCLCMLFEEGRDVLQWLDNNFLTRVERFIPKMGGLIPALLAGLRKRFQ